MDQSCGADELDRVIGAVCQASRGSVEGFKAMDELYARRHDYPGRGAAFMKWQASKRKPVCPDGFAVLCEMVEANGFDPLEICGKTEPHFEPCEMSIVEAADAEESRLSRYSLTGHLEALERAAVEQVQIFLGLALLGQAWVVYAAPNFGKTLLTLWLLIESIKSGVIDASRVWYINVDDSLAGLIEKLRLAQEFRFHMVAEGHRDFRASNFVWILNEMINKDECQGVVVILDVAKKFVDVMDKRQSTGFGKVIRRFVLKGGTAILLAHTNKRLGTDGRPVYGGTTDVLEDVDAAFIGRVISDADAREKVVTLENIKRRGNVRQRAVFGYSAEENISYDELLASVRLIADTEMVAIQKAGELKSDAELIAVARGCIMEGIDTKMLLASEIASRSGCSKRVAIKLIERYTGTDPKSHCWTYKVRERGAKVFTLLEGCACDSGKKD